ncbi:MAG: hypothetical protein EAZ53_03870 [Bacteroidetes bacterium]|nr:MAG: hypothetical protein EAZ53_03870 [Bacteroidota bacterium]
MNIKLREELAKTLIDIGKYIFAGVVLSLIVQYNTIDKIYLISLGVTLTILFIVIGLFILKKE